MTILNPKSLHYQIGTFTSEVESGQDFHQDRQFCKRTIAAAVAFLSLATAVTVGVCVIKLPSGLWTREKQIGNGLTKEEVPVKEATMMFGFRKTVLRYKDPSASIDDRIDDLLERMTINEKTMQLATLYGYKRVLNDKLPEDDWEEMTWIDGIANIDEHLNGLPELGKPQNRDYQTKVEDMNDLVWPPSNHAKAINDVQRWFMTKTRLGIPVDFSNEGIRGLGHYKSTNFPIQIGLGSTWDPKLIENIGQVIGREARALGYTNVYSPVVDLARDPRWGRVMDCFSEDPFLVAELATAMAKGIQSQNCASTAKHWAVYSVPKGGRDGQARTDPHVARRELETLHLAPWRKLIREGKVMGAMSSYNDYDGVPISSSSEFMVDILRSRFGFQGYIVSDSRAILYLYSKHRVARNYTDAARMFLSAGGNVRTEFDGPENFVQPVRDLIKQGLLPMSVVDDRVRDVLRVKFQLGLFDKLPVLNPAESDDIVHCAAHEELAKDAARRSLVLLKNSVDTLPLSATSLRRILVCGPGATEVQSLMGRYGSFGGHVYSVLSGIKEYLEKVNPDAEVIYEKGVTYADNEWPSSEIFPQDPSTEVLEKMKKACKHAKYADAIIMVMGESNEMVGESKSRTSLELPGHQNLFINTLANTVKGKVPIISVLLNGRPLSVNYLHEQSAAVIETWFAGEYAGMAVAETIFGEINPGGKLPVTFPRSVGQIEYGFPYKPGSQSGMGKDDDPNGVGDCLVTGSLFPFGFGLSYTSFVLVNPTIAKTKIKIGDTIKVSVDVKNTGQRAGDEVVQLYLRDMISSVVVYEKMLRGFERVTVDPGDTVTVSFSLGEEDMSLLGADAYSAAVGFNQQTGPVWTVEPGDFEIELGTSSENIHHVLRFEVIE